MLKVKNVIKNTPSKLHHIHQRRGLLRMSAKTAIKQGLTMEVVRRRRGIIGNWEALMGLYWGFEWDEGAH